MKIWAFGLAVFASAAALWAKEPVTFSSGPRHVVLIELFTSEGCSSCPPAEDWLAAKRLDADLWRAVVPVSWHVDFWNRLGWPDRFSTAEFTAREYTYARDWQTDSVYTPCFARDGREWRPSEGRIEEGGEAALLTLRYDGRTARGEFAPATVKAPPHYELHVVLLAGGIASRVTAGENRGHTLTHEFVALGTATGELGQELPLPRRRDASATRYAIAAWVTKRGASEPLQAVGGWLPAE